jgi:hypothetical protein
MGCVKRVLTSGVFGNASGGGAGGGGNLPKVRGRIEGEDGLR